jgi:hypothetical protein
VVSRSRSGSDVDRPELDDVEDVKSDVRVESVSGDAVENLTGVEGDEAANCLDAVAEKKRPERTECVCAMGGLLPSDRKERLAVVMVDMMRDLMMELVPPVLERLQGEVAADVLAQYSAAGRTTSRSAENFREGDLSGKPSSEVRGWTWFKAGPDTGVVPEGRSSRSSTGKEKRHRHHGSHRGGDG